jgi:hypothetical protein
LQNLSKPEIENNATNKSAVGGAHFVPMGMPSVFRKTLQELSRSYRKCLLCYLAYFQGE